MFIRLRWVLGNSLCGLKAETIGHYARYIVAQEIGFQPTAAEMGLGLAAAEGETEEAKHE
jgi:hypothetical protein